MSYQVLSPLKERIDKRQKNLKTLQGSNFNDQIRFIDVKRRKKIKPQFSLLLHQSLKKLDLEPTSLHPLIDNIAEEEYYKEKDLYRSKSGEVTEVEVHKTLNVTHSVPTISKIAIQQQENNKSSQVIKETNFNKSRVSNEISSSNIQLSLPPLNHKGSHQHINSGQGMVNSNQANLSSIGAQNQYKGSFTTSGPQPKKSLPTGQDPILPNDQPRYLFSSAQKMFPKRDSPSKLKPQEYNGSRGIISAEMLHQIESKKIGRKQVEESHGSKIQMLQEKLQRDIKLQKLDPEEINKQFKHKKLLLPRNQQKEIHFIKKRHQSRNQNQNQSDEGGQAIASSQSKSNLLEGKKKDIFLISQRVNLTKTLANGKLSMDRVDTDQNQGNIILPLVGGNHFSNDALQTEDGVQSKQISKRGQKAQALGEENEEIIESNITKGQKFGKLVCSLYQYDDRTINFEKARKGIRNLSVKYFNSKLEDNIKVNKALAQKDRQKMFKQLGLKSQSTKKLNDNL